jgi:L,D-peptidoglycan transpeptidase YkuD (ErfK/YbiS/YcfS/YnhG family)
MYRICLVLSALLTAALVVGCAGVSGTKAIPTITSVSPSTAVAGSQNAKITVSAANLSGSASRHDLLEQESANVGSHECGPRAPENSADFRRYERS